MTRIINTLDNIISPDQLAPILRQYAQQYREDAIRLSSDWQDDNAGLIWTKLADVLDAAASKADAACKRYF
jgi:hypothetical protein